jgi:mono/diheme cytochrome c family protein
MVDSCDRSRRAGATVRDSGASKRPTKQVAMHRSITLIVSAFATALLAGCASSDTAAPASSRTAGIVALTADLTAGKVGYTSNCSSCHGSDGKTGSVGRNVASEAASNQSATVNRVLAGGEGMPAFGNLNDQEVADIVGYLKTLK